MLNVMKPGKIKEYNFCSNIQDQNILRVPSFMIKRSTYWKLLIIKYMELMVADQLIESDDQIFIED